MLSKSLLYNPSARNSPRLYNTVLVKSLSSNTHTHDSSQHRLIISTIERKAKESVSKGEERQRMPR